MPNKVNSTPGEVETVQPKQGTWRTYDVTDGLPGGIRCMFQDHQGYLWLGTTAGLCRYDGVEFLTYTVADGLAANIVTAICEDREGRLWFGTEGGGVSCFDGARFITYTVEDGLLDNRVNGLLQDREGGFWFAQFWSGLMRFDTETVMCLTDHPVSQILIQDSQGCLWFGDENDLFCLFEGQARRQPFARPIYGLLEDSRGYFWVATEGDGLYRYDSAEAVWPPLPPQLWGVGALWARGGGERFAISRRRRV